MVKHLLALAGSILLIALMPVAINTQASVLNDQPIVLTGTQSMVISDSDYTIKNNIILRDNAVLTIKNSTFTHANDFSGQYSLSAYNNSKVVIQNSTIKSSPWVNWNFFNSTTLQMTTVTNTESQIWHGFHDTAKATISGASKFNGTLSSNSSFDINKTNSTFIETVFPVNATVKESFPKNVGSTRYTFPNKSDSGINTSLIMKNVSSTQWGITYVPQNNITISNTNSLVVTFNIPSSYTGLTAEFDNLKAQLYSDKTWNTGNATLRLINTSTLRWSPIVAGNNHLIIRNSELADNAFSFGNATVAVYDSSMSYIKGNDYVQFTLTNTPVSGDVVATNNSIINLIDSPVGGQIVKQDNGQIIVTNTINQPPTFNLPLTLTLTVGVLTQGTIVATDPEGAPLTFSMAGLPSTATLNSNTGLFSWTPIVSEVGTYTATITVSDGVNSVSKNTTVTVN